MNKTLGIGSTTTLNLTKEELINLINKNLKLLISYGFKIVAHNAGLKVIATNVEIHREIHIVTANCI